MKRKIILLFLLFILAFQLVSAVPKIEPYVNDFANILSSDEEMNLNLYVDSIEKNTSWEIAIVTVINTEGQDRVEYANKIGDENGVGKKDKDNGIVILYSLEDGGAIATGRYSESIFNDAKVGRIGRENKHYFDEESYYDGFLNIIKELEKEINEPIKLNDDSKNLGGQEVSVIIFIILMFVIFSLIFPLRNNSNSYSSGAVVSSSGSSFSGGSFGGGGAKF